MNARQQYKWMPPNDVRSRKHEKWPAEPILGTRKRKRRLPARTGYRKKGPEKASIRQKRTDDRTKTLIGLLKLEGNRRLKITTNGVELESKEIEKYVPACEPKDKKPSKPRLLRCDYPIFDNTSTNDNIPGERMKLESKGHDKDVTIGSNPGIDRPGMSHYFLRARHVPMGDSNPTIHPPSKSRYPLRSKHRTTDDADTIVGGLYSTQQSTSEDKLMMEDSELTDIDDISLRTAGVHLV